MMMQPSHSPFEAVLKWFRQRRDRADIAAMDPAEAERLARDLNLSVLDLTDLVAQSENEAALLGRMLQLHGIDRKTLEEALPGLVRDMAATCAHCQCKGKCTHDLDHNVSTDVTDQYCPNAGTMRSLADQ